jgi:hypothetical protein
MTDNIANIARFVCIAPPAILAAIYIKDTIKDLKEQYRETGRLFAKHES